ncbi:MAG TPA: phosphate ABC transporter permease PstA [Candidatus Fimadaptatus faecigallinarum]|uniref:Phosphate transport system permease protein PstA n=1 Tax=Candidatus Fimadaptatus faecigallinarum TaxID=2840814 RepID=A0A9D1LQS6_9FIRM|nr:phosphate ABC transporter permease PstA [Candidatus Fimadaptatus faecigallinarum]
MTSSPNKTILARRRRSKSALLRWLCYLAIALTVGSLMMIVAYICINGVPHLSWELLFGEYSADNPSMGFAIAATLELVALSLVISGPLGVGCAVYLCEYAPKRSRLVSAIRLATETLAGIPSIIYGLFGALFFGTALGMGYSMICGILTISIMVLPTIIRTSEEAILSVDDMYREGSYGLGAGKLRTIFRIVLPSAAKGIISSFILATGRIVGETAALLFTLGSVAQFTGNILDSSRTLAVHMYINTRDGGIAGRNTAFAAGVVLLIVVIAINLIASWFERRAGKLNEN